MAAHDLVIRGGIVIDGTGEYASVKGQGTESGTRDHGPAQSLDATLTGRLQ